MIGAGGCGAPRFFCDRSAGTGNTPSTRHNPMIDPATFEALLRAALVDLRRERLERVFSLEPAEVGRVETGQQGSDQPEIPKESERRPQGKRAAILRPFLRP